MASKYQLSSGMISHWVKKYLESGETSLESKKKGRHCQGITANKNLSEIEISIPHFFTDRNLGR